MTGFLMRCTLPFAAIALFWHAFASAQTSVPQAATILLVPQNAKGTQNSKATFVTRDFAIKLGALILEQAGVSFDAEGTTAVDKDDVWWVTFTVREWPKRMEEMSPGLPNRLTFWIRKRDGAILSALF